MRLSAVVLDMDGLMLDTEPLYKTAWQQASAELGYELDDVTYSILSGRPTEDCEAELVARFGPAFPMSRFRDRWAGLWSDLARDRGIPHKPGLLPFLAFLEAHRLPAAIATSSDADYAEFSLRKAGLAGRVPVVVTGDQVQRGKPAPDIFIEAARRLGHDPSACLALEDSDAGVLAACAAGMVTVCVPDLKPPSDAAARAAFQVLGSLDDVRELIVASLAHDGTAGRRNDVAKNEDRRV